MSDGKLEILVVEDEEPIRRGLCDVLAFHGYRPTAAEDGETGLRQSLRHGYALLVLDIMLPGMDGFEVCRELRNERRSLPVLMLTARGSEEDVLAGFRAGADDYVTKPFSVAELMARVEALLRRSGALPRDGEQAFRFGDWQIDPTNLRATCGEEPIDLTPRELAVISLFHKESGRIVSRRSLLSEVWGSPDPDAIETRSVDMQIAKLRKKLRAGSGADGFIETVRGVGYRYVGS